MTDKQPKVTRRKLADYKADPANANKGTERGQYMLENSLNKYGAGRSVLADKNGYLIAGNKTTEVAGQLGFEDVIEVETDGKTLVVVRRADLDLINDPKARELAYSDNRAGEVGLEWDVEQLLADKNAEIDLGQFFHDDELEALLSSLKPEIDPPQDAGAQVDKAAELQQKWQSQPHQVWEIPSKTVPGKAHRLICGDCTDENILKTLFEDVKFAVVFTDPPYGIKYDPVATGRSERQFDKILNDDLEGQAFQDFNYRWLSAALPFQTEDASYYVCGAIRTAHHLILAAERLGLHYAVPLVWVKQHFVLNWDRYHPQHEWIFYGGEGSKPTGKTSRWYGENNETTVWSIARDNAADYEHPTQKPVELPARAIRNSSASGEIIADFFLGSGTTLIASEQLGRICYGTEIHPPFFAVILDRMERMGLNPRLIETKSPVAGASVTS